MQFSNKEGTLEQKQSGPGIASFCISIVASVVIILVDVLDIINYSIFSYCISLFIPYVALGLGIWGLIQKDRKKLFASIGTILSVVIMIYQGYWMFHAFNYIH
jgi:hypothetical protein